MNRTVLRSITAVEDKQASRSLCALDMMSGSEWPT